MRTTSLLFAILMTAAASAQQPGPPSCAETEEMHALDFWLGEWDVFVGDQLVGTNRIEPILDRCAVMEHWTDAGGNEGKSLFYYLPSEETWKQVWVTERALAPGGLKEKTLVETFENGGTRFQGTIVLPEGRSYLDRTTLTPIDGDRVRQVIEISTDGGKHWESRFDAVYVPK